MRKYKVIILITLTVLVSCRQMPKQESSGDNIDVSHFLNLEQEIRKTSMMRIRSYNSVQCILPAISDSFSRRVGRYIMLTTIFRQKQFQISEL